MPNYPAFSFDAAVKNEDLLIFSLSALFRRPCPPPKGVTEFGPGGYGLTFWLGRRDDEPAGAPEASLVVTARPVELEADAIVWELNVHRKNGPRHYERAPIIAGLYVTTARR